MAWNDSFKKGISSFKAGRYEESLSHLNKAVELESGQYILYDSRAAVFDKLNRPKDALRDAKKVISLAPERWHGYLRSARVFLKAQRRDAALTMIEHAYERLAQEDTKRRAELDSLKAEALRLPEPTVTVTVTRPTCQFGHLPVEICVEIFREIVSSDPALVLLLSRICKRWRAVTLNTATLWDTLVLTDIRPAGKTRLWIKRSKGMIRELHVRNPAVPGLRDLLAAFQGLSWNAIRILKLDVDAIKLVFDAHPPDLSNLENLNMVSTFIYHGAASYFLGCAGNAMRSLSLQSFNFPTHPFAPQLTNLTSLSIRGVNLPDLGRFLDVIRANIMLKHLVLDSMLFRTYSLTNDPSLPVQLPFLTSLVIAGNLPIILYCHIICPSLKQLFIQDILYINDKLFSSQEMRLLTELRIQRCGVPPSLVPFLCTASSLEIIQLSHISGVANTVVEALADGCADSGGTTDSMCPSLTHLDFSHCSDLQSGPLMRLVKFRLHSTQDQTSSKHDAEGANSTPHFARISSVVIDGCPLIDSDILPWLRSKVPTVSCVYATKKMAKWRH